MGEKSKKDIAVEADETLAKQAEEADSEFDDGWGIGKGSSDEGEKSEKEEATADADEAKADEAKDGVSEDAETDEGDEADEGEAKEEDVTDAGGSDDDGDEDGEGEGEEDGKEGEEPSAADLVKAALAEIRQESADREKALRAEIDALKSAGGAAAGKPKEKEAEKVSVKEVSEKVKKHLDGIREYEPEIAEGIEKEIEALKTLEVDRAKIVEDASKAAAISRVEARHPNFLQDTGTVKFKAWLVDQPTYLQRRMSMTDDPDELIAYLDMYKGSGESETTGKAKAAPKAAKRRKAPPPPPKVSKTFRPADQESSKGDDDYDKGWEAGK